MSNKTIDAMVYCPFYVAESSLSITCEGIIGSKTVNKFDSLNEKIYHETAFCTDKACAGCGVYSALMMNYNTNRIRH